MVMGPIFSNFVQSALATYEMLDKSSDRKAKNNYYNALLKQKAGAQASTDAYRRASLGLKAHGQNSTDAYRGKRLKQIDSDNASKAGLREKREKAIDYGLEHPKGAKGSAIELPEVPADDVTGDAPGAAAPAGGAWQPQRPAVQPWPGDAPPAAPGQRQALPVGSQVVAGGADETDDTDETDEPDDTQDYAEGGEVEPRQVQYYRPGISADPDVRAMHRANDIRNAAATQEENETAVDTSDIPAQAVDPYPSQPQRDENAREKMRVAQPHMKQSTGADEAGFNGTSNSLGFNAKEALDSWEHMTRAGDTGMGEAPKKAVSTDTAPAKPKADNPVAVGLKGMMQLYADSGGASALPVQQGGSRLAHAIQTNAGAASPQEVKAMDQALDPHKELNESAHTIQRLDAGVKFYLARGDDKKAAQLAHSLIMYGKLQSQQFGALAAHALQQGDNDRAAKYIARAYDTVPDGQELKTSVTPDGNIQAQVHDIRTGETKDLGTFGGQQALKFALRIANGQEYMERMVEIASGGKRTSGAGKAVAQGQAQPRVGDWKTSTGEVQKELDATDEKNNKKYNIDGGEAPIIHNVASQLYQANRGSLTAQNAIVVAGALADPNNAGKIKIERQQDGSVIASSQGAPPVHIPADAYARIISMRGERATKASSKEAADTAKAQGDLIRENDRWDKKQENQRAIDLGHPSEVSRWARNPSREIAKKIHNEPLEQ